MPRNDAVIHELSCQSDKLPPDPREQQVGIAKLILEGTPHSATNFSSISICFSLSPSSLPSHYIREIASDSIRFRTSVPDSIYRTHWSMHYKQIHQVCHVIPKFPLLDLFAILIELKNPFISFVHRITSRYNLYLSWLEESRGIRCTYLICRIYFRVSSDGFLLSCKNPNG